MSNVIYLSQRRKDKDQSNWETHYRHKDWLEVLEEYCQVTQSIESNSGVDRERAIIMLRVMQERAETIELRTLCEAWLKRLAA